MAPTGTAKNEGILSQYVVSYYVPELPSKQGKTKGHYDPRSCVSYAKYKRPDQNFIWGTPNQVEAYNISPAKGLLVLTREGDYGHVGYIEEVTDSAIVVSEANWVPGLVTTREIPKDSPIIRGFR